MSEATKVKNYTEAQEAQLVEAYEANPTVATVEALVAELGKTKRSVIAKLSNLGVYKTPVKTTKAGKAIVRKEELVNFVEVAFAIKAGSLVKANKADLEALVGAVRAMAETVAAQSETEEGE